MDGINCICDGKYKSDNSLPNNCLDCKDGYSLYGTKCVKDCTIQEDCNNNATVVSQNSINGDCSCTCKKGFIESTLESGILFFQFIMLDQDMLGHHYLA